jgi:hypothetical protein
MVNSPPNSSKLVNLVHLNRQRHLGEKEISLGVGGDYGRESIDNSNLQLIKGVIRKYQVGDSVDQDASESIFQNQLEMVRSYYDQGDFSAAEAIISDFEDTVRFRDPSQPFIQSSIARFTSSNKTKARIQEKRYANSMGSSLSKPRRANEIENMDREININAMKDDGATYTTVSDELVRGLKAVRIPLRKKISLGGFNSSQEWATEFTLLELDMEGMDEFDQPIIATIILRAIIAPTLQGSLLLGGNLIKKHRICIDPDTTIITMFRGNNLFRTTCIPWSLVQQGLSETTNNVKSLFIQSVATVLDEDSKPLSHSTSMFPNTSLVDAKVFENIRFGTRDDVAVVPPCPKYTEYFDKAHGIFGQSGKDLSVYKTGEIPF